MLGYMLLGQTRKCVTNLARVCFFVDRHISSWERFPGTIQLQNPPNPPVRKSKVPNPERESTGRLRP
jgi:hypothetical protein